MTSIRLTQTVKKGGCAAKLPAGTLRHVLNGMPLKKPTELLVGTEYMDDACLWDLHSYSGWDLVQTLDFFTPIVDDPRDFGAIAAANSISDIYAMGGVPKLALTILAFPMATLPESVLAELMQGAIEKIHEAGAALAGGHTIDDDTLKLGFSVTGFVKKGKAWINQGAQAGDRLILTKGLGTGTIATAIKNQTVKDEWLVAALQSMKTLNNACEFLDGVRVSAATDITGFGLLGHLLQMARASEKRMILDLNSVPVLEGALNSLQSGNVNRAHRTNWEYVRHEVALEGISELHRHLLCDAQTSGGLLLSVPDEHAQRAVEAIRAIFPMSCVIGRVELLADHSPKIEVKS